MPCVSASIRYARSGDVSIAYQVTGDGPFDLVVVHGFFSQGIGFEPRRTVELKGLDDPRALFAARL
jgi:hypothetical protein